MKIQQNHRVSPLRKPKKAWVGIGPQLNLHGTGSSQTYTWRYTDRKERQSFTTGPVARVDSSSVRFTENGTTRQSPRKGMAKLGLVFDGRGFLSVKG